MKNKMLIKATLVTLLAPTFLSAQQVLAVETSVVTAPVEETQTAPEVTAPIAPPTVEVPEVATPVTPVTPEAESPATPPVVEAPEAETPVTPPVAETPEVATPVTPPVAEATPTPSPTPTPTPTPDPGSEEGAVTDGANDGHWQGEAGGKDAPILAVAPEKMLKKGEKFNPMAGVSAYDSTGDVTSRVKVVHNVDTSKTTDKDKPYQATYTVDSVAGGPVTKRVVDVFVLDDKEFFMLSASITDFSMVQNGDLNAEIRKRLVVKNDDGSVVKSSDYRIMTNGSTGGGETGTYAISVTVESLEHGAFTEVPVKVTVLSALTLTTADKTIYVGDSFDPVANVTAIEHFSDGTSKKLALYDGKRDVGLDIVGTVDTQVVGDYKVIYSAKTSGGVNKTVTSTITVKASELSLKVNSGIEIMQGETFVASKFVTAQDGKDGDLSDKVTSTPFDTNIIGPHTVTFEVTNSSGTTVTETGIVTVVERKSTITASNQEVYQGQVITPQTIQSWAVVTDPVETDLVATYVVREGALDTSISGTVYNVDYTVINSSGVTTTASITVTVTERLATITATDQTVQAGETITNAMILAWATASDLVDGANLPVTEFKLLDGPIDTSQPGSVYRVEYSYTNSANNTTTKTIKVSVANLAAPTLEVSDQVMFVGDKLTEEMILAWAKTENAVQVSYEFLGAEVRVTTLGNKLVEAGVHKIKFTAHAATTASDQDVSKTITLTVKDNPEKPGETKDTDKTTNLDNKGTSKPSSTKSKASATKKTEQTLPQTSEQATGLMMSLMGMVMVIFSYFSKKRKNGFEL